MLPRIPLIHDNLTSKLKMEHVDIGFVEECDPWRLESRFFPSKIGGAPAWLELKNIPTAKEVECKKCGNPCVFLCQVYAPYENDPLAFHRTLFVFICKNEECCKLNQNENLIVLRSQLTRENEFYSFEPPEETEQWQPDLKAEKFKKTCNVCRLAAPSQCAKCKNVNYCSRVHQILDWREGHKKQCTEPNNKVQNFSSSFLFPEFELAIEPEDVLKNDSEKDELDREKEEIKKFESMLENGEAGTMQSEQDVDADLLKMASNEEDEAFTEFCSRINKQRDQVLRYHRGGSPLYISSLNQPEIIPNCEECGGERHFEFQIMPQLLTELNFTDVEKSLDWGILAIFTCKNSCVPKSGYVKEFVWKQDIVEAPKE